MDAGDCSVTANHRVSSTGNCNTSPAREPYVTCVNAQLAMRMKELKSLQRAHEQLAKGQADSAGGFGAAPKPLGVKIGRKLGSGSLKITYDAIYEGEWASKTAAIKVRPYDAAVTQRCASVHARVRALVPIHVCLKLVSMYC